MKKLFLIPVIATLAACGSQRNDVATFTCPNGPDLSVSFSGEGARITFPTGRVEQLQPTDTEELYAKPGVVFDNRQFRTARLTDGDKSYSCDQMAG
ncbi:MAG: hypothetical protein AAGA06_08295 [Pseudomonadota bacterium]